MMERGRGKKEMCTFYPPTCLCFPIFLECFVLLMMIQLHSCALLLVVLTFLCKKKKGKGKGKKNCEETKNKKQLNLSFCFSSHHLLLPPPPPPLPPLLGMTPRPLLLLLLPPSPPPPLTPSPASLAVGVKKIHGERTEVQSLKRP